MTTPFAPNATVVVYLAEPREKVWGVLRSLDAVGVALEGVDLRSFDEWVKGIAAGEIRPADVSLAFYPLARVEKILMDRGSDDVPSLGDQFLARVGVALTEFLRR